MPVATIERVFDGSSVPPTYVFSVPAATDASPPASVSCTITSPSAGASLTQGVPITITGTISVAGTVNVSVGSSAGAATMVGLAWTFVYTPAVGDIGPQTVNAVATATVSGAIGNAAGVAVTVAAAGTITVPGGSLGPVQADNWWFGTGRYTATGAAPNDYAIHDANSYVEIVTSDTAITIEAVPTVNGSSFLTAYVNGVEQLPLWDFNGLPAGVAVQKTFAMSAGANKTVVIEETLQAGIRRISTPGGYTLNLHRTPSTLLIGYGDSVTAGANGFSDGFLGVIRRSGRYSEVIEYGISGKKIADDSANGGLIAATTAAIVARAAGATGAVEIYYAMGVNDWIVGSQSAATVAGYLVAQIASIHAALPNARIYYQAPFGETTETNVTGSGDTLLTFISTLTSAAAGLPYVTSINGRTQLLPGVQMVGPHPTVGQHATIAAALLANFLGVSQSYLPGYAEFFGAYTPEFTTSTTRRQFAAAA